LELLVIILIGVIIWLLFKNHSDKKALQNAHPRSQEYYAPVTVEVFKEPIIEYELVAQADVDGTVIAFTEELAKKIRLQCKKKPEAIVGISQRPAKGWKYEQTICMVADSIQDMSEHTKVPTSEIRENLDTDFMARGWAFYTTKALAPVMDKIVNYFTPEVKEYFKSEVKRVNENKQAYAMNKFVQNIGVLTGSIDAGGMYGDANTRAYHITKREAQARDDAFGLFRIKEIDPEKAKKLKKK
jgi:hypothetical protein